MSKKTFNPISEPLDRLPAVKPGTVAVCYHKGKVILASQLEGGGRFEKVISDTDSTKLIACGVGLLVAIVFVWLVFGKWMLLLLFLAVIAASLYLLLNRDSPIAVALLGTQPTYYLVDLSRHEVTDSRRIQLADTAIFADVEITFMAKVNDTAKVFAAGIRDVREHLSPKLYARISKMAPEGKLSDNLSGFRDQLRELAGKVKGDDCFLIEDAHFEIQVDKGVRQSLEKIAGAELRKKGIKAENEVREVERERFESLLNDDKRLISEMMRPDADRSIISEVIHLKLQQEDRLNEKNIRMFKLALAEGIIEGHDIDEKLKQRIIDDAALGVTSHPHFSKIGDSGNHAQKSASTVDNDEGGNDSIGETETED